jgi:hypothetical protein
MVEVYERILGPHALPQFFPRKQLSRAFEQRHQDLDGLFLTANAHSVLPELSSTGVDLKCAKSENSSEGIRCTHGGLDVLDGKIRKLRYSLGSLASLFSK